MAWGQKNRTKRTQSREAEIRRYRDSLIVSGGATIAFILWGFVKTILYSVLGYTSSTNAPTADELIETMDINVLAILILAILIVIVLAVILQIYVGLTAIAVGRGKRRRRAYIYFAALLAFAEIPMIVVTFYFVNDLSSLMDTITTTIVDLTATFALVDIVHSSRKLQKLGALEEGR